MGDRYIKVENELQEIVDSTTAMKPLKKCSIYKIPEFIADLNSKAYTPTVVSFGPYHHGNPKLKPMEFHKKRSLVHFLERTQTSIQTLVSSFAADADELKESYCSQLDSAWEKDTNGFLKLLILDGCFMLEIFKSNHSTPGGSDDPIFGDHGQLYVMPVIKRDMLMLENQLPILVLEKLLSISDYNAMKDDREYINKLILRFCNPSSFTDKSDLGKCLHVLDIFRKSLFTTVSNGKKYPSPDPNSRSRSATELKEAGVRFKPIIKRDDYLNKITFEGGVLKLPTFIIDDSTESIFLNMIAFERCHIGAGNEATSYICFMDNLIDDSADIRLLQRENIVQNYTGSDVLAANLFNTISKDLTIGPGSSLDSVHRELTIYCGETWHSWRATFTHNYFTNPWAIVSVIAAIALFALTIWQAVYGSLSYYQDKKNNNFKTT